MKFVEQMKDDQNEGQKFPFTHINGHEVIDATGPRIDKTCDMICKDGNTYRVNLETGEVRKAQ